MITESWGWDFKGFFDPKKTVERQYMGEGPEGEYCWRLGSSVLSGGRKRGLGHIPPL
jgi:hypothetical protein